ncbi:MAG: hypothetical protein ACYDH9_14085 [Limisphaerales bacterium]
MKEAELGSAVLAGQKLVIGDFRDWEVVERPNSKEPSKPYVIEQTYCAVGREIVCVRRFLENGAVVKSVTRPGYKAGDRVVVRWENWEQSKYGTRASGVVESLDAN